MIESGTHLLAALMSVGMAWAFLRADPDSPTTSALSLALAMMGLHMIAHISLLEMTAAGPLPRWAGLLMIPEAVAIFAAFEWAHRVHRTIPAGELNTRLGDKSMRIAQGLAIVYGIFSVAYPDLWLREFFGGLQNGTGWSARVMLMFGAPLSVAIVLWVVSMLLCLNRRPDPAERARLVAVLFALPLVAAALVVPLPVAPATVTLGLIVLLAGAMRHAQLHGRRGLFLSRFLSPQVATLVNRGGLRAAMQEDSHELSIVCCDLRGFTTFAGASSSEQVLQLLREYYDAVGVAVLAVEGTIKDYAGDGVLILLGAPLHMDDHAQRAVALADRLRSVLTDITRQWSRDDCPLGIGAGVASGRVTVGIIGGAGRLEYAAVGQAVNLASRLCEQAGPGEILIDRQTVALIEVDAAGAGFVPQSPLTLKGFRDPVANFALSRAST